MMNSTIMIMLIDSDEALNNMKACLANYTSLNTFGVLCLANNEERYLECRKFIAENNSQTNEVLISYKNKKKLNFADAKALLKDTQWVFLWDNQSIIAPSNVETLINNTVLFSRAGIISGHRAKNEYLLEDIYLKTSKKREVDFDGKRYARVDMIKGANFITRFYLYKDFDWAKKAISRFSMELRQLGFNNIVDRMINYK